MDCTVNYKVRIGKSVSELSEIFAQLLIDKINSSDNFFTLALSGGSTPKSIFDYLSSHHQSTIDWQKVEFFWGDERCVKPTDSDSNYKMADDSLLSKLKIPEQNIFRIKGENDPQQEADQYSSEVLNQVKMINGLPRFDLIMLGLGEDGHTASIFPNQKKLLDSKKIAAVAVHPGSGQKRITLTGKVINNAAAIVFIATGKNKATIVNAIINQKNNYKDYPASFINPKNGELYWLLDEESSRMLSRKL